MSFCYCWPRPIYSHPHPPCTSSPEQPALGFTALLILSLLLCTSLERLTGKPPASSPVSYKTVYILASAAALLYFAFGFLIVAPTVPWVRINIPSNNGGPGFVYSGSMLNFYFCQPPLPTSTSVAPFCVSYDLAAAANTVGPPPVPGTVAVTLPIVASTASNIAVCCYVFSLLLLLPAAVLTSVSAYRLKLHLAHGQPTPTEGCAAAAHPLANTDTGPSIVGMPGPVVGALAIACSLVASALLLFLWSCFPGLASLPGYGAGCSVTCNANPAAQQQAQPSVQMQAAPVFATQYMQAAPPQGPVQVANPCV